MSSNRAERRRQEKGGRKLSAFKRRVVWIAGIVVMVLAVILTSLARRDKLAQPQKPIFSVTSKEIETISNALLLSMAQSDSENVYMPKFMKDQIRWVMGLVRTGQVKMELLLTKRSGVLMYVTRYSKDTVPTLVVDGRGIMALVVAVDGRPSNGFSQKVKDSFAVTLVHEAIHLRGLDEKALMGEEGRLDEEVRAHMATSLFAVRPMLAMGHQLFSDLVKTDSVLRACGDVACPAFREYIRNTAMSK